MYVLNKKDGGFEIFETQAEIKNSYSRIVVDKSFLENYNINIPCYIDKSNILWEVCNGLIIDVNKNNNEEKVPNKKVTTDVPGTSKLIRSKDKQTIEITFRRRRKDGTLEQCAKSNNTCYISNENRESFFASVKYHCNQYMDSRGHWHYCLYIKDASFKYWSDFMDKEYKRLCSK